MTRARAALVPAVLLAAAALALSGASSTDPRTPPPLPGLPPPFLTTALLGGGGVTAGIDAYGGVVDLRPGPAGRALIHNPADRQAAGTVAAETGIVTRVAVEGGPARPLWRADSVHQRYLPDTNVLRTVAAFGDARAAIECAATEAALGCVSRSTPGSRAEVVFSRNLVGGGRRVHLDDLAAYRVLAEETADGRFWLRRSRPLGPGAPPWANDLYRRSLLVLRASTDRSTGAVAAGARDGWAHVWPRDAGAVAIALAAAGYRPEARRIARFLLGLDLDAAARFDGEGEPVPGRDAQGDAAGWVVAAARAAGLRSDDGAGPLREHGWRDRADYQEVSAGDYLGNAIAAGNLGADGRLFTPCRRKVDHSCSLVREAGDPGSGLDSAAAWAVRPFPTPALFPAARRTLLTLSGEAARFGIVPSQSWPHPDPWSAPTAWSAWSLAALARREPGEGAAGVRASALRLLAALRRTATPAGLLPERVDGRTGVPTSTTPLAWSHAFAILALRELWPERSR